MAVSSATSPSKNSVHGIIIALAILNAVGLLGMFFKLDMIANNQKMTEQEVSECKRTKDWYAECKVAMMEIQEEAMKPVDETKKWMPFVSQVTTSFSKGEALATNGDMNNSSDAFIRENGTPIPFKSEMIGQSFGSPLLTVLPDGTEVIFYLDRDYVSGKTPTKWKTYAWNLKTTETVLINETELYEDRDQNYLSLYGISGSKLIYLDATDNSPGACDCTPQPLLSTSKLRYLELSTPNTPLTTYVPASGFTTYMDQLEATCQAKVQKMPECRE